MLLCHSYYSMHSSSIVVRIHSHRILEYAYKCRFFIPLLAFENLLGNVFQAPTRVSIRIVDYSNTCTICPQPKTEYSCTL